jgi:Rrf2 family transcriptional regulator, nitric oxide-sensitive transcriptional repressor
MTVYAVVADGNIGFAGMRLTSYTDYALRTLMYLGMNRDRLATIQDIADTHGIAKNHLTKVVHQLGQLGFVETVRGRSGGLRLGCEPADINVGEVVRSTETDFYMASCFDAESSGCLYSASCALKGVLGRAADAFLEVLDGVTLDKLIAKEIRRGAAPALKAGGTNAVELQFKPTRRKA